MYIYIYIYIYRERYTYIYIYSHSNHSNDKVTNFDRFDWGRRCSMALLGKTKVGSRGYLKSPSVKKSLKNAATPLVLNPIVPFRLS